MWITQGSGRWRQQGELFGVKKAPFPFRQAKGSGFATLREQLAADAAMLREVSAS